MEDFDTYLETIVSDRSSPCQVLVAMKRAKVMIGQQPEVYQTRLDSRLLAKVMEVVVQKLGGLQPTDLCNSWQFLHNACAGRSGPCGDLWRRLGHQLMQNFRMVTGQTEEEVSKLANVLFAVAFQLLRNTDPKTSFSPDSAEVIELSKAALGALCSAGAEEGGLAAFPLLCLQELLKSGRFTELAVYNALDLQHRQALLDVLAEELDRQELSAPWLTTTEALLRKAFKARSDEVLTALEMKSGLDPIELTRLTGLLGTFSSRGSPSLRNQMQADRSFLINAVYLLRMVHEAGKAADGAGTMFKAVRSLDELNDNAKLEAEPVFGFKRDLIRLIGNLCYDHKVNQDQVSVAGLIVQNLLNFVIFVWCPTLVYVLRQVREIDGIELLLDCSAVDGKNPFITQWVVFAIRNICLGNQQSQAVLSSISKSGKVDRSMLSEVGVQLEGTNLDGCD